MSREHLRLLRNVYVISLNLDSNLPSPCSAMRMLSSAVRAIDTSENLASDPLDWIERLAGTGAFKVLRRPIHSFLAHSSFIHIKPLAKICPCNTNQGLSLLVPVYRTSICLAQLVGFKLCGGSCLANGHLLASDLAGAKARHPLASATPTMSCTFFFD